MYWLYCWVYKQCVWTKTQIILQALHLMSSYTICRLKHRCPSSFYTRVKCRGVFCADWQNFGFGRHFFLVLVVTTSEYWLEDQVLFRLISLFSPRLLPCTPWVINLEFLHCFIDDLHTSFIYNRAYRSLTGRDCSDPDIRIKDNIRVHLDWLVFPIFFNV